MSLDMVTHSPEETRRLGARLGELARPGDVLLLVGELGVGKTCLAQGMALGLGITGYTLSPSFVLVREYQGRLPLYHIDFYRLDRVEEIRELGLEDYLYSEGVCVIEWAEKGLELLPGEHLKVRMWHLDETERRIRLEPVGARYQDILSHLQEAPRGS